MNRPLRPELPILMIDDEEGVLISRQTLLLSEGFDNIICCDDPRKVPEILKTREVGIVLLDLTMPHTSGRDLLDLLSTEYPAVPVIIVTGTNEVSEAVDCMKRGAFDYMVKAVEQSRFVSGVRRAAEHRELESRCRDLKERLLSGKLKNPEAFSRIITRSERMKALFLYAEAVAGTEENVLICGETGVGKELLALAIHNTGGREGPYLAVNAAGLDDTMFSDTLFGHRKGAFTGAADSRKGLLAQDEGGTILLDEIGDLTPASQVKLLRLMETGEYFPLGSDTARRSRARVLVSTNRDLEALMTLGHFRKDLYYRLRTHQIIIPPLRERKEDLPLLLNAFIGETSDRLGIPRPSCPPQILTILNNYSFPGNVRELKSLVSDAVSRSGGKTLSVELFRQNLQRDAAAAGTLAPADLVFPESLPTLKEVVDQLIREALKRAEGNQTIAADLLGITKQALSKRLKRKEDASF